MPKVINIRSGGPFALALSLAFVAGLSAKARAESPPATAVGVPRPASQRIVSLHEAEASALQMQPQLRQTRASSEAAAARIDESRAAYLPQVTGTALAEIGTGNCVPRLGASCASTPGGSVTYPNPVPGGQPSSLTITTPGQVVSTSAVPNWNYLSLAVTGTQLITDFGATQNQISAARTSVASLKDSERATENTVLLNVQSAFLQARAQHTLVHVAEDTLANVQKHLTQTEGFVRVGTQPEIALAQSRTDVANARVTLINAQNVYETSKALLNQAMGIVGDTDYEVSEDTLGPVPGEELSTNALVSQAVMNRPDLAALKKQREAQEYTLDAVKAQLAPVLSAIGSVSGAGVLGPDKGSGSSGAPNTWVGPNANYYVGAQLTWGIFQGGITKAQIREQQANLRGLDAQVETLQLQVQMDIETPRLAIRAAKESIIASNDALANAREQLRLAEGRYASGVGSIIELGDSQITQTNAAAQVVQAEYNLALARAQLRKALGLR